MENWIWRAYLYTTFYRRECTRARYEESSDALCLEISMIRIGVDIRFTLNERLKMIGVFGKTERKFWKMEWGATEEIKS